MSLVLVLLVSLFPGYIVSNVGAVVNVGWVPICQVSIWCERMRWHDVPICHQPPSPISANADPRRGAPCLRTPDELGVISLEVDPGGVSCRGWLAGFCGI